MILSSGSMLIFFYYNAFVNKKLDHLVGLLNNSFHALAHRIAVSDVGDKYLHLLHDLCTGVINDTSYNQKVRYAIVKDVSKR
jgi:hypothetical protein